VVTAISALDRKLLRDFTRLWPQALAIALVVAAGFATLILGVGAGRSLQETRAAYYERYAFADVFVTLKRAPKELGGRIREIPGVAQIDVRIVRGTLLDVPGLKEPASGIAISLPSHTGANLNKLHLRVGRLPQSDKPDEAVVSEGFARANNLGVGAQFSAILDGRKRTLRITGVALSPEYIYAMAPGDLVPDDRRFAVMWMPEETLAAAFDLDGAFNSVAVKLLPGTRSEDVIAALDKLLERYGGLGAYTRENQTSHAFLDSELNQLAAMSRIVPPIFLAVSAFLINMTLSRLIALEREQIGLLKALGYARTAVAAHYVKFVLLIACAGSLIGAVAGTWLGRGMTQLYGNFFHFPFLIFERDPDLYVIAFAISASAAVLGALRAVLMAFALPPAIAMQPPVPQTFAHLPFEGLSAFARLSRLTVMSLRGMLRAPARALTTLLGLSLATSLLITAMFTFDSVDYMIDVSFFRTARQDASLVFNDVKAERSLQAVARLPGVMRAEGYRAVAVKLRNGHVARRTSIIGKARGQDLNLLIDSDLEKVEPPEQGLLINARLAQVLGVKRGDSLEVEVLEGRRTTRVAVVSDIVESYLGLGATMEISALNRLLQEGPVLSGAHVALDDGRLNEFYSAVKETPAAAGLMLQKLSLAKFRETIGQNINIMTTMYIALAVIIAWGVVYNSARILLSERARDLASLRVLGFSRGEVGRVLLTEVVLLVLLAQPLGWILGQSFAWAVIQGFSSDLFSVPFVIESRTYARASLVVLAAAAVSILVVRRRIDTLDLVAVLKTRE
jgi:putative ABC transport system permease protein